MALACVTLAAGAQTTNVTTRSLTLRECIDLALEHNLAVQLQRYGPEVAKYTLKAAYGAYDPTLSLSASRTFVDQPPTFDPKKLNQTKTSILNPPPGMNVPGQDWPYQQTLDSVGPSLSGVLPTGLKYSIAARSDHMDATTVPIPYLISTGTPPGPSNLAISNNYSALAGITLSQPFLKDSWIDLYRRTIQVDKKRLKISEQLFRAQVMAVVTSVASNYFRLIDAREQVGVQLKALEVANKLLEQTVKRVKVGDLPPLDEKQVQSSVETIKTALFAAEQAYEEQENDLKNLLSEDFQKWTGIKIEPSEALIAVEEPVNRSESWLLAMTQRPDLLQARLSLQVQDINVRFDYNQLFPSLDAVGSYGWLSTQPGFSATLNDLRNGSMPYYSVGVVFSFPLGNITARNNYKASQAARKQIALLLKELEQNILVQVDTALKLTETTYKQVSSTRKAREFAEAALEAEQKKYDNGLSTPFLVLQFQDRLTLARSAEVAALAAYNVAKAQLAFQEGSTLEKNKIELKVK
jgi:outer membrane protein TolC